MKVRPGLDFYKNGKTDMREHYNYSSSPSFAIHVPKFIKRCSVVLLA